MTAEFLQGLFGAIIGSGTTVAIIDWVKASRLEKKAREVSFLKDQLQYLYGPLQFLTKQNKELFDLSDKIQEASSKHYKGHIFTEQTREDFDNLLEMSNKYVRMALANSGEIVKILREHYYYIDPDDEELFVKLVVDHTRLTNERDETGKLITLSVYQELDDISFMRQEFIKKVNEKFQNKKEALTRLVR